jgi:hypothetical protein
MSDARTRPRGTHSRREGKHLSSLRLPVLWLSRSLVVALPALTLAGLGLAQSQQAPSAQPPQQQQTTPAPSQQSPSPTAQAKPQVQPRRITTPTVADMARDTQARIEESAPEKVFTNEDAAELPPGGISIVGPLPLPASAAKPIKPVDNTAKQAAYWKARFTAARQKLAQDKKALPALQSQVEAQRVWEDPGDPDTGQLYSDTYMDLAHQIDAMKIAIQNDKKALSDLYDEFHHAGGLPGWIR